MYKLNWPTDSVILAAGRDISGVLSCGLHIKHCIQAIGIVLSSGICHLLAWQYYSHRHKYSYHLCCSSSSQQAFLFFVCTR